MGKKCLVLAGGGTRGSYQAGAMKVLEKHNVKYDIVTGTSIGSLNGCMVAQKDLDNLYDLWDNLQSTDIVVDGQLLEGFSLEKLINERNVAKDFVKKYFKEKGADVTPLKNRINSLYSPERLAASDIDYGCMVAKYPGMEKSPFYKDDILKEGKDGGNYLLASASCWPAFPVCEFKEKQYIDGGYYDNCPIEMAVDKGATEGVVIDLDFPPHHPEFVDSKSFKYIYPHQDLGSFLEFDPKIIHRNMQIGFNDASKVFGDYDGMGYTFEKFDDPNFFTDNYLMFLVLDGKIKKVSKIYDNQHVINELCKRSGHVWLGEKDMNLAMLDEIMKTLDFDLAEVYKFNDVMKKILEYYTKDFDNDYSIMPTNVTEALSFVKSLDTKGIVKKLLAQLMLPDKAIVPENVVLTLYPFEQSMALWIYNAYVSGEVK